MSTFVLKNLRRLFDKYAVARTEHDALVKSTTKIFSNFVAFSENPNFKKRSLLLTYSSNSIRTEISWGLAPSLLNWFKPIYWPFGQSNMYLSKPARKESYLPKLKSSWVFTVQIYMCTLLLLHRIFTIWPKILTFWIKGPLFGPNFDEPMFDVPDTYHIIATKIKVPQWTLKSKRNPLLSSQDL